MITVVITDLWRARGRICEAARVLALIRLRVPDTDTDAVVVAAQVVLTELAARPGHRRGVVGRSTDDPTLWVLATEWDAVGAYRRGLSSYDVKVSLAPLMPYVLNEPSAYEVVAQTPQTPAGVGAEPV